MIAHNYFNKGEYDQALDYLNRALTICKEQGYKRKIVLFLNMIGDVYLLKSEYDQAADYYTQSMKINEELEELYKVLEASSYALCFGGRLAVISFHSMEDRMVKRFIQGKDRLNSSIRFSYIGDKFIKPTSEEIKKNPRSRSAILRVAEKVF